MTTAKGALVGIGVMVLCFIIPGVNFVAGPLAPLIAGFVVGKRMRPDTREALVFTSVLGVVNLLVITGLLMWNSGRVTPDRPYILLAAYVVGVLGLSLGLARLGVYLGQRSALRNTLGAAEAGSEGR